MQPHARVDTSHTVSTLDPRNLTDRVSPTIHASHSITSLPFSPCHPQSAKVIEEDEDPGGEVVEEPPPKAEPSAAGASSSYFGPRSWCEAYTEEGKKYYYDEYTDTTQWEKPDDFDEGEEEEELADEEEKEEEEEEEEGGRESGDDAAGGDGDYGVVQELRAHPQGRRSSWVKSKTAEGTPFYHDQETGESQWEQPTK